MPTSPSGVFFEVKYTVDASGAGFSVDGTTAAGVVSCAVVFLPISVQVEADRSITSAARAGMMWNLFIVFRITDTNFDIFPLAELSESQIHISILRILHHSDQYFPNFARVKVLLLILSLLLSLFSGRQQTPDAAVSSEEGSYCLAEAASSDAPTDYRLNRDLCITAAQGLSFSGEGGSNPVSLRSPNTGRRTPTQLRSSTRFVKGGKVIDNNRTHPFPTPYFVPLSGTHISERYLFSICRLRL